jgi:hypothetical protein
MDRKIKIWIRNEYPGSISESLEANFWVGDEDQGSGIFFTLNPGSEMDKFGSGIRDKHPRSANTEYHTAAHDSIKQIGMSQKYHFNKM